MRFSSLMVSLRIDLRSGDRPWLDIRVGENSQHMFGCWFDVARVFIPFVRYTQATHDLTHEFWIECDEHNTIGCWMNCGEWHVEVRNPQGLNVMYTLPSARDAQKLKLMLLREVTRWTHVPIYKPKYAGYNDGYPAQMAEFRSPFTL